MADFPALPLWTDAYLADTRHLSTVEHGAYLLLLMEAWRRASCSLPDDDRVLSRLAGMSAGEWANIKPVVMAFWHFSRGEWVQKRLKKERTFVSEKREKQRNNALSRWNKTKSDDAAAIPNAYQKDAPTPTPTPIKKKEPNGSGNLAPADPSISERAVEMWNDLARRHSLTVVQKVTDTRAKALKARLEEAGGLDGWAHAIELVERSSFLLGDNDRGWTADFDFLLQRKSFTKLMEGGYPARARRGSSQAMAQLRGMMGNGK